jgi:hypothetical protein
MAKIAKRNKDQLSRLKQSVESSRKYFLPNYRRFDEFRKFIYDTSISDSEKSVLDVLKKPQIECNILEAFVSRLCGEFSKQEPSINVSSVDGNNIDLQTTEVVQGYIRGLFLDANHDSFQYDVYRDLLSGGFSVMKVWTEYQEESFDQIIKIGRPYDVTMTGFDPLARKHHKGDGRYCFELFPKTKEEFEEEFPDINVDSMTFSSNMEGFSWSYYNENEEVIIVCDLYEKKKSKKKLVKLSDGKTMLESEYEDYINKFNNDISSGRTIRQPATIVKSRMVDVETICRYRFIENQVLEYLETDYKMLPLIFVDGNSVMLKNGAQANVQMTRPYVFQAKGTQKLKNFAMQTLANELENMVQHKWKVAKEGIPPEYSDAYTDSQIPNVLIYNAYKDNNPALQLPAPMEVVRPQIPQEITNTLTLTDNLTQMILGSFDSQLGINDNQLSGVAIVEAATQSNSAAMPYIVGFLRGLNRLGEVILDLLPKYYKMPRTLPIIKQDGARDYVSVNQPGGVNLNYGQSALQIKVEAGVNFAIQKSRALNQLTALMQASPLFAQFMNADGLEVLVDNLEIYDADQLKVKAKQYMQQMKQQQAMAAKQAQSGQQNNPMIQLKQQELQLKAQQMQSSDQYDQARLQIDQEKLANERLKMSLDAKSSFNDQMVQADKAQAERQRSKADVDLALHDQLHRHAKESAELIHNINQSSKDDKNIE